MDKDEESHALPCEIWTIILQFATHFSATHRREIDWKTHASVSQTCRLFRSIIDIRLNYTLFARKFKIGKSNTLEKCKHSDQITFNKLTYIHSVYTLFALHKVDRWQLSTDRESFYFHCNHHRKTVIMPHARATYERPVQKIMFNCDPDYKARRVLMLDQIPERHWKHISPDYSLELQIDGSFEMHFFMRMTYKTTITIDKNNTTNRTIQILIKKESDGEWITHVKCLYHWSIKRIEIKYLEDYSLVGMGIVLKTLFCCCLHSINGRRLNDHLMPISYAREILIETFFLPPNKRKGCPCEQCVARKRRDRLDKN